MADTVSSFFASFLPDNKPRRAGAAPSRLTPVSQTVGSTPAKPPAAKETAAAPPTTFEAMNLNAAKTASSDEQGRSVSNEEIRNLRGQFLDERFGAKGKGKGKGVRGGNGVKVAVRPVQKSV